MAAAVPKLALLNVGSGGGWGLGEQYADLIPAEEQVRQGYVVAVAAQEGDGRGSCEQDLQGTTDPDPPASHNVYAVQPEEDDQTFVDHGSSEEKKNAAERQNHEQGVTASVEMLTVVENGGVKRPVVPPLRQQPQSLSTSPQQKSDVSPGVANASFVSDSSPARGKWQPGRVVSEMQVPSAVHAMAVDGRELWVAVGDDPLVSFNVLGCDLQQNRMIGNATHVRAIVIVKTAIQTRKTFSLFRPTTAFPKNAPTTRKNSHLAGSAGTCDTIWCGRENGTIAVCSLFFLNEECVIHAHSSSVVCLYAAPNNKVWSSGRDGSLKLWDPVTRKCIHRMTVPPQCDFNAVLSVQQVWSIGTDGKLRLWDYNGNAAKADFGRTLSNRKLPATVLAVRYHAATSTVWVCLADRIRILSPRDLHVVSDIQVHAVCLEFTGGVAVAIAQGGILGPNEDYQVAVFSPTNPQSPQLLFRGSPISNPCLPWMQCLVRDTLAAVVHYLPDRSAQCVCLITTQEMAPLGRWGAPSSYANPLKREDAHSSPYTSNQNADPPSETGAAVGTPREDVAPSAAVEAKELPNDSANGVPEEIPRAHSTHPAVEPSQTDKSANTSPQPQHNRDAPQSNTKLSEEVNEIHRIVHGLQQSLVHVDEFGLLYQEVLAVKDKLERKLVPLSNVMRQRVEAKFKTEEARNMALILSRLQATLEPPVAHADRNSAPANDTDDLASVSEVKLWKIYKDLSALSRQQQAWYMDQMQCVQRQHQIAVDVNQAFVRGLTRLQGVLEGALPDSAPDVEPSASDLYQNATPSRIAKYFDSLVRTLNHLLHLPVTNDIVARPPPSEQPVMPLTAQGSQEDMLSATCGSTTSDTPASVLACRTILDSIERTQQFTMGAKERIRKAAKIRSINKGVEGEDDGSEIVLVNAETFADHPLVMCLIESRIFIELCSAEVIVGMSQAVLQFLEDESETASASDRERIHAELDRIQEVLMEATRDVEVNAEHMRKLAAQGALFVTSSPSVVDPTTVKVQLRKVPGQLRWQAVWLELLCLAIDAIGKWIDSELESGKKPSDVEDMMRKSGLIVLLEDWKDTLTVIGRDLLTYHEAIHMAPKSGPLHNRDLVSMYFRICHSRGTDLSPGASDTINNVDPILEQIVTLKMQAEVLDQHCTSLLQPISLPLVSARAVTTPTASGSVTPGGNRRTGKYAINKSVKSFCKTLKQ